jgi:hypothetical protein
LKLIVDEQISAQGNNPMSKQAMIDTFQKHVGAELAGDLDTTMATMSDDPHLNHVPTMVGGVGREACATFIATIWWANSFRRTSR